MLSRYKILSRIFFINTIILDIYNKTVVKIKKMLAETDAISVTTDMWTCLHNSVSFEYKTLRGSAHWSEHLIYFSRNVKVLGN